VCYYILRVGDFGGREEKRDEDCRILRRHGSHNRTL
jgi:hypothetical protein